MRTENSYVIYGPRDTEIGSRSHYDYGAYSSNEYVESIIGVTIEGIGSYNHDEYRSESRSYYDIMGNYIEYVSYDEEGNLINQSLYSVDRYGYDTGHTYSYYCEDGTVDVSIYDADGNEIATKRYDAAGNEIK